MTDVHTSTGGRTHLSGPVRRSVAPVTAGLVAFLVSVAGSWIAPAGVDEAATMSAVRRSLPDLWRMAHHVDGVHSTYYGLMHLWFEVVPYSLFALRLPSAIAVGVGAALLVVLTRRLADGRVAFVAGLVFAVLPRTTSAGLQGRSYALSMTMVILLTLVFVVATERTAVRRRGAWLFWVLYAVVALLCAYVFLYSVLTVGAHGVSLLLRQLRRRGTMRALLAWLLAAIAAGVLLLPFVHVTSGESAQQLYWIGTVFRFDARFWSAVLVQQYAGASVHLAVVLGVLALVGTVTALTVPRLRYRAAAVEVSLPVLVVPLAAVVAVSVLVQPFYNSRYLTFTAPFVAVLVAVGACAVRWRIVPAVAIVLVAVLAAPTIALQRQATHKEGSHWVEVVDYLEHARSREADPGHDGIVYGPLPRHTRRTTEYLPYAYPEAFHGLRDLTLVKTPAAVGELWAERLPSDRKPPTDGIHRIWYVGARTDVQPARLGHQLLRSGWREGRRVVVAGDFTIVSVVRDHGASTRTPHHRTDRARASDRHA